MSRPLPLPGVHEIVNPRETVRKRSVDHDKGSPLLGERVFRIDRLNRALRFARSAIDALLRINHKHPAGLVDAIHGTNVDTGPILYVYARLSNDVSHDSPLYKMK